MIEEEISDLRDRLNVLERALELAAPDIWKSCDVQGHNWTWKIAKDEAMRKCLTCGRVEDD